MKKITLLLMLVLTGTLSLRAQDADSLKFDQVHLGLLLQANYAGEAMYIAESSLSAYPGAGVEAGGFVDYMFTRRLLMEVQLLIALQSGSYVYAGQDPGFVIWRRRTLDPVANMRLWGMDIPIYLVGLFPAGEGNWRLGAGLFTHFTFNAWSPGSDDFITPYKRVISVDDATGKKRYALNDSHAGVGITAGYEFASGLQINLAAKYSVIDIINYDSPASHAHPYKISLGVGWRF